MSNDIGTLFGIPSTVLTYKPSALLADPLCCVGIEVELEGLPNFGPGYTHALLPWWKTTIDHSLRNNGKEFILGVDQPLFGYDIIKGLEKFKEIIDTYTLKYGAPELSERTSLHGHFDARDLTYEQVKTWVTLLYVFEDILFAAYAPYRHKNNYCLPISRNQHIQDSFKSIIQDKAYFLKFVYEGQKYAATNIHSMAEKGSIELRMLQATWDAEKILGWINLVLSMRNFAKDNVIDLSELPENISSKGIETFLNDIFGEYVEPIKDVATTSAVMKGVRLVERMIQFQNIQEINQSFVRQGVRNTKHIDMFKSKLEEV